ncbi:hypothetical protein B0H63DRAFT_522642 [Podospora didyma]|uniref:Ecp2 effector protein domain-containing protein n=1 Tax=Podospora didyma TaxID=330526 RepID=A0AAE0NPJ9_9PEZI|nr:hypothetical protein B0H63DRAFT_522642 [Podospora didyma]
MVNFNVLATVLALGAISATGLPTSSAAPAANTIEQRQFLPVRMLYCTDKDFKGNCETVSVPVGQCHNIREAFNDKISSFDNKGSGNTPTHCIWYQHYGCTGIKYGRNKDSNLDSHGGAMNDFLSSFVCYTGI